MIIILKNTFFVLLLIICIPINGQNRTYQFRYKIDSLSKLKFNSKIDTNTKKLEKPPLIIIDGIIVDYNDLTRFDSIKIKSIKTILDNEKSPLYEKQTYKGMILIETGLKKKKKL